MEFTREDFNAILNEGSTESVEETSTEVGVKELCMDNVVSKDKLRNVQGKTLNKLAEYIQATYGPLGSNTMIVSGNNKQTILSNYSKDGLKVLKHIIFSEPLEMAIQSEIENIARFVERKVGDGTTSSIILSSEIFDGLSKIEKEFTVPPRKLIKLFDRCVKDLQEEIRSRGREITLDDIYKICMISTNGNESISKVIENLYMQFGFDVQIDVGISNDSDSKVKIYDGATIDEGYLDDCYINRMSNATCEIRNARIYYFADPIDTAEMLTFLDKILLDNIFSPLEEGREPVPTVILSTHITRDGSALMRKLSEALHSYDGANQIEMKPPVLIVSDISGVGVGVADDIAYLCDCKPIVKYIDPKTQKADQEKGEAPTIENIAEWCGYAEQVIADADKTKFINPKSMQNADDKKYESRVNFLKAQIKKAEANNDDHLTIGRLKKRLRLIEGNMIEYLIGGIAESDRDAVKDLVEDAVKNCASASSTGVGYAANFEGLRASMMAWKQHHDTYKEDSTDNMIIYQIKSIIAKAYYNAAQILYTTAVDNFDDAGVLIYNSIINDQPYNIATVFDYGTENIDDIPFDGNVLCSISTDIEILEAIDKIVTIMVTANQALVQVPTLNRY